METLDLPLALPPTLPTPPSASDQTLVTTLAVLAKRERELRATFIVHLAEFDRRRLYLPLGFSSLFAYLTERLRFSNASAFRRVTACRLHARMPIVGAYLQDGRLSLNKLCQLRELLAPENCAALLEQAASLTEKEVEELALILGARTARVPRDSIRPLPPPRQESLLDRMASKRPTTPVAEVMSPPLGSETPTTSVAEVTSVRTPESACARAPALRHVVNMTVGPEFLSVLEKVRAALSHSHPGASLETLLLECMKTRLAEYEKRAHAKTHSPRPRKPAGQGSKGYRHIPAHVRRAVWERDEGRCTFVSEDGRRCNATHRIELHHTIPYAHGGPTSEATIVLMCKLHNDLAARADFGDAHMNRFTHRRTSSAAYVPAPFA